MNDKNILNLSPFHDRLIDGMVSEVENKCGFVPFEIGDYKFDKTFIIVDGIYPPYSRFV